MEVFLRLIVLRLRMMSPRGVPAETVYFLMKTFWMKKAVLGVSGGKILLREGFIATLGLEKSTRFGTDHFFRWHRENVSVVENT